MQAPHHEREQGIPKTVGAPLLAVHDQAPVHESTSAESIHRLPVELISRVLLLFVSHVDRRNGRRAQPCFVAASICQTWRKIMLSSPSHWPTLYLEIDRGRALTSAAEYVHAILERSQQRPLHVRLNAPFAIDAVAMATLEELLPSVIKYAGDLEIQQSVMPASCATSDFQRSIVKFLVLPTPCLQMLTVVHDGIAPTPFSLLPSAPQLRSLKLICYTLDYFSPDVVQNLRAIMLSLVDPTPATIISLSSSAPFLERMDLRDLITEDDNSEMDLLATVPPFHHLRTLHLASITQLSYFRTEVFPVLTTLELFIEDEGVGNYQLPALPLLRTLRLSWYSSNSDSDLWDNVLFLLLHFPQIERFDLDCPGDTREFWPRLLDPSLPALPQLQILVIEGDAFEGECGVGEFVHFLKTRHHLARLELRKTCFPSWMRDLLLLYVDLVLMEKEDPEKVCLFLMGLVCSWADAPVQ